MMNDPTISVMCDECHEDFYDYELTALAGGGWDARYIGRQLLTEGWKVDGDRHVCPDCVEAAEV